MSEINQKGGRNARIESELIALQMERQVPCGICAKTTPKGVIWLCQEDFSADIS
jgi:hypothetical protein